MNKTVEKRLYGNFRKPVTAGLSKLSGPASYLLLAQAAVGFLLFAFTNIVVGVAIFVYLVAYVCLMIFEDRHGITPIQNITERITFMINRRKKLTSYRAGLLNAGHSPLPGLLSGTDVDEHEDSYQRPFALTHFPKTHEASVTFECHPTGGELHDEETIDQMVANTGGFGAAFATQSGVRQYMYVIETGPNFGTSARNAVERQLSPSAPELAKKITRETTALGSASNTTTTAYTCVTFATPADAARNRKDKEKARALFASDISRRMPAMMQRLTASGAGHVTPCSKQQLAELMRTAYDPLIARTIESARANGSSMEIDWQDAGPQTADAEWDLYRHDSGISVTFVMTIPARGTITSDVLRPLLLPHPDIHRKRVALIRRPIDSGRAADTAEANYNAARIRATSGRASAAARTDVRIADAVREEVSSGAGLEDFTILVTITVIDAAKLPDAVAAIETQLAPTARIVTRIAYGAQDTAFAATLPVGLNVQSHNDLAAMQSILR